jgi:hypothetical protein
VGHTSQHCVNQATCECVVNVKHERAWDGASLSLMPCHGIRQGEREGFLVEEAATDDQVLAARPGDGCYGTRGSQLDVDLGGDTLGVEGDAGYGTLRSVDEALVGGQVLKDQDPGSDGDLRKAVKVRTDASQCVARGTSAAYSGSSEETDRLDSTGTVWIFPQVQPLPQEQTGGTWGRKRSMARLFHCPTCLTHGG